MKVNDLRINNYVEAFYFDDAEEKSGYFQITGLSEEGNLDEGYNFLLECNGKFEQCTEIEPIILTDELFVKGSFTFDGTIFTHPKLGSVYFKKPFKEADYYLVKSNGGDKLTTVKYLHNIQNFFHIFTGEELDIVL